ncbi:plasmid replication protein, CyRepA1 family [Phormidium tenue]|uniref:DUF3854 domain-containing protein n=1 Tax=Phormidium tenue NIES-30 TaxID=549789 RepID=A0A1U7IYG4_9CYAN|nr:plasmid replication protein, CyRepA1 family [Phormidium tenue]MBD2234878.1 DUF3854 domain-containing protein [Phormidium tenue FACHB-1052]OKH43618.1 hypothetical protein NIES30_24570 [Phormidium tenue NIES-30]
MKTAHLNEWQQSQVAVEIIQANVSSIEGQEVIERLAGHKLGAIGGWGSQYVTGAVGSILQRYENSAQGGWWVSGLDPLNNWAPLDWGQFKADTPDLDGKGKPKKYTSPEGTKPRALYLDTGNPDYWPDIIADPAAPVLWTEGAKKSGCGLSLGLAAIALVGVNAGYRVKDALGNPCKPELVDDVKVIATPGRPVYLAFDQDIKPKARRRVLGALMRFGGLLAAAGCIVRIVEWSAEQGKGLDDLVANHGPDALHQAINQALTLDEWRLKLALDNCLGGLIPSMRINTRNLDTLDTATIPDTGIIALRSAKGTGKTNLVADLVSGGGETLVLGHRIVLMRNLCRRLGVNYRGDIDRLNGEFIDGDGYTLRVGGCVDGTLLAIDPSKFKGCDLILDEFVQLMRHLLTSSTCNKDGARPVLLARFTQLVQAARRVIVADADLDKTFLDYIAALRGDGAPAWLLVNDAKVEPWPVTFIESPDASAATARLVAAVKAGKRVLVVTDSKAGSKRLDCLIREIEAVGLRVLLLNSDTSGGDVEKAIITNPNQTITDYPVVIATPSMATGVSIEVQHFDEVHGLFWGASSTDADMAQALARVRQPVPRIVWCAKHGRNFSKIGRDTNPMRLRKLLQDKANATAQLTAASLGALGAEITGYDWLNPHVDLWAKIEAQRNRSMLSLRSALKVRLTHEGHYLTIEQLDVDLAAREQMAAVRLQIKEAEAQAIADAANLSPSDVKALEKAETVDPDERLALQKWHLADFYVIPLDEVTADLVLLDNDGRYRGQLQELEAFLHPELASTIDARSVEKQAQHNLGICPWDISTAELRRQVRGLLGIDQWITCEREWSGDDEGLMEFAAKALDMAPQVKAALNVAIRPDMSPQQILGQLLDQMGIETASRQSRQDGRRCRWYQVDQASKAQALGILMRRVERRKATEERYSLPGTPPPINVYESGGCAPQKPPKKGDPWAGVLVLWGASLGSWVVLATDGDMATIQLQNPVVQTVRTVPLGDLVALEVAA